MVRQGSPQVVRVRIAPSPTGIPHIGNTRTALFNYLFAKHNKGKFILRIEDTDQKRAVLGAKEAIIEILEWLGISPDETYIQSERLEEYKKQARVLLDKKIAYEKDGAVWMKIPKKVEFSWQDAIGSKKITFKSEDLEDFVILKSDGFPTYHLASVVDDHLMQISHVIRGNEWMSSTPKHLLLYQSFSWKPPVFAHLPLILGPDKKKLSKRHGAKSVLDYRNEGFLKEALLNFMALLGWNPGGDKEIMFLEEMIKLFDLKDVNSASPIFDLKKLEWMNGVYIRKSQISHLRSILQNFGGQANLKTLLQSRIPLRGKISDEILKKLILLAQTRMTTLNDFYNLTRFVFEDIKIKFTDEEKLIAKKLLEYFQDIDSWNKDSVFLAMKKVLTEGKIRMPVLYKIITGKEQGLPLPQTLEILGKEKTLKKLEKILKN